MDAALQETIDYVALRRLQDSYADIVNRRAWDELKAIFLPGVTVTIDRRTAEPLCLEGPEEVGRFIGTSIEGLEFFEFVILTSRLFIGENGDADRAAARMYMSELRQDRESGRWSTVYGLYQDRYQRQDGQWWFAERRYASLGRTGRDFDVFALPPIERL